MTNTAEVEVLIINIENIRERASKNEHEVIDLILAEVRKTSLKFASNDLQTASDKKRLDDTYLGIQAYQGDL